ncbi:MAG: hypothetical protein E7604_11995 [Ruminococcaceae bacterium]|nr:hypothetical protein [Oscillospiraceae bacterium]
MTNRRLMTLVLALLVAAATALTACTSDKDNGDASGSDTAGQKIEEHLPEDTVTDAPEDTTAPAPVMTEPPVNELDDVPTDVPEVPTDDPAADIPAVEMPEDEEPVVTEPDTPTAEQGSLAGLAGQTDSGRFTSEQSPNLVLCIDWESVIGDDGTADVTVTVGISHYRLFSREKFEMGAVQVDGNAVKFSTPKIEYDENTKTFTEFYTATYETTRSEMEVEASWQVLGKYGDIEIDTLTAGGTIVLADNS